MDRFTSLIIVGLIAIIVLQRMGCGGVGSGKNTSDTLVVRDTTWQIKDSIITKKVALKEIIHDTIPPEYLPDTNYAALKAQYEALVDDYIAKRIYTDTLKLDTLGYVAIADTVNKNQLFNRSYSYNYKIPTITEKVVITKTALPKSQLYVGGGVNFSKTLGVESINAGLLLKTKKDQLFGLNVGSSPQGQLSYGFQSHWKIKL
jgi:hypothetical protein